jgi:hypothetical protein
LLSKLYALNQIERKHEYECLSITLINDGSDIKYEFLFEFKLEGLEEDNIEYYGIVSGTSTINNISIIYTLIASNKKEKVNLGNYSEDTQELIDSLVLLKESNGNRTTLSYKMLYCHNYFGRVAVRDMFRYISTRISLSRKVIEES